MARTFRQASREMYIARGITISDYLRMERGKKKGEIAAFIEQRFSERYVEPHQNTAKPSGFAMMATACLMIETLQCFRTGEAETGERLKEPNGRKRYGFRYFQDFFSDMPGFSSFSRPKTYPSEDLAKSFYKNVRCGILHQGETTGGWLVRRDGKLFEEEPLTINAELFLGAVDGALRHYGGEIRRAAWDSDLWVNCRKKLAHTVAQGRATTAGENAEA